MAVTESSKIAASSLQVAIGVQASVLSFVVSGTSQVIRPSIATTSLLSLMAFDVLQLIALCFVFASNLT